MDRLSSHQATKEVVQKHNFKFSKSLGQNFLIDTNVIDRILEGARVKEGDYVIEVGPGIGTLTKEMGRSAEKVVAIEIDKTLIPILEETLEDFPNIEVINQDILKVNVQELVKEKLNGGPVKLVANLPYYITTPIVMKFLEEDIPVTDIVVMVQKEVADRMNAKPNTKDYGALSVAVQYYCDTEIVAKAPRHMFMPQPNVDSTVIGLHVREEQIYHVDNEDISIALSELDNIDQQIIIYKFELNHKPALSDEDIAKRLSLSQEDVVSRLACCLKILENSLVLKKYIRRCNLPALQ